MSSSDDFVVVLPTGSGKSLFWLYLAMVKHGNGDITVVVVSLVSVLLDQVVSFACQNHVTYTLQRE
jgi:superfamily II DNA helicase RecQ